jgi:hypothetical protein
MALVSFRADWVRYFKAPWWMVGGEVDKHNWRERPDLGKSPGAGGGTCAAAVRVGWLGA